MYIYQHGGNAKHINENIVDFSANINPLGVGKPVLEAIISSFSELEVYPDNFSVKLRNSIASFESVDVSNVFCSNGASDIIFRLTASIKPKKALLLAPTFADYERALLASGCEKIECFKLLEENGFNIKNDILEKIANENYDMLFICNPNNPTGCLTEKSLMESIIKVCDEKKTYLVVDECFLDFVLEREKYSVIDLIGDYKKIVVLRAFTKIFALPGVRLGYALLSDSDLMEKLYLQGADWAVSSVAQAAGMASLSIADEYINKTKEYIKNEKQRLKAYLESCGFKLFGSHANYIFFKSSLPFDLYKRLYNDYNIAIRSCGNYVNLSDKFYRIGVQKKEENQLLINAIVDIIGE